MNPTFDLACGIPLGYAFLAQLAEVSKLRLLILKGLQLHEQGLRSKRTPTDIDVLLHPRDVPVLCAALRERGWTPAETRAVPGVIAQHATTLVHSGWPCPIDVHWYCPGFFAPAEEVFEHLWALREEQHYAGQPVWGLQTGANAVVIALHHARHIVSGQHSDQHRSILGYAFSTDQIEQIDGLSRAGRCCEVISELRTRLGLPYIADLSESERRRWRFYQQTNEDGSTSGWLQAVLSTPWRGRPGVLREALWPSSAALRSEYSVGPGASIVSYRLRRLARGLRALPRALRSLPAAPHSRCSPHAPWPPGTLASDPDTSTGDGRCGQELR